MDTTTLDLWEHSTEGRKLIVSKRLGGWTFDHKHVTFSDANNNGIFETHSFFDAKQWTAAGYGDDASFSRYLELRHHSAEWAF